MTNCSPVAGYSAIYPKKKNKLYERFGEHRRSVENPHHLSCPTPISEHFNLLGHSTKGMQLIPLELIRNSCTKSAGSSHRQSKEVRTTWKQQTRRTLLTFSSLFSSVYHPANPSPIIFIVFEFSVFSFFFFFF